MSNVTGPRKPAVSNLPPRIKQKADHEPLFILARESFKHSPAGKIDNVLFRQRAGLAQETARLADRSLEPYIESFALGLEQREVQQGGSFLVKMVIEFGCGLGRVANLLTAKDHIFYTGVELSEPLLRAAKMSAKNRHNFQLGDLLTFRTERTFNAAVAIDVLSALSPQDQLKALANLDRLLAAKGRLLLRWEAGDNDVQVRSALTPEGQIQGWVWRATKGYIQRLLEVAGFYRSEEIVTEPLLINAGTPEERALPHHIVLARK